MHLQLSKYQLMWWKLINLKKYGVLRNHVYEKGGLGAHSDVHSCKIQFNKFSELSKQKIYKLKSSEQRVNVLQCSPKNL